MIIGPCPPAGQNRRQTGGFEKTRVQSEKDARLSQATRASFISYTRVFCKLHARVFQTARASFLRDITGRC